MDDTISRQAAIDALWKALYEYEDETEKQFLESEELDVEDWFQHRIFAQNMSDIDRQVIINLPSAQPERLTDDDFETIRIHLNAYKEQLCNQRRWKEAEDYQRLIDRFMGFASAQPTLYGYNIEHLKLIARVLQKEDLPPERVVEALTDIGRIVAIVRDEFEESLRKAVEQCKM